jgi:carbonic anhydrase
MDVSELIARNAAFAATGHYQGLSFPAGAALRIVSCVDARVEPSDVLGIRLGEAVTIRNIGGRITPTTLNWWRLLGIVSNAAAGKRQPAKTPHLVILQHTDCGIRHLADHPAELADYFGISEAALPAKAVLDPYAAVRVDVNLARQAMPPGMRVSGLVYDVDTGVVKVVMPLDS